MQLLDSGAGGEIASTPRRTMTRVWESLARPCTNPGNCFHMSFVSALRSRGLSIQMVDMPRSTETRRVPGFAMAITGYRSTHAAISFRVVSQTSLRRCRSESRSNSTPATAGRPPTCACTVRSSTVCSPDRSP